MRISNNFMNFFMNWRFSSAVSSSLLGLDEFYNKWSLEIVFEQNLLKRRQTERNKVPSPIKYCCIELGITDGMEILSSLTFSMKRQKIAFYGNIPVNGTQNYIFELKQCQSQSVFLQVRERNQDNLLLQVLIPLNSAISNVKQKWIQM